MEEKKRRTARSRIKGLYPDEGPFRRELYSKHTEFFAAGDEFNERALLGGNRCLTPWTVIATDRGERQVCEVLGEPGLNVRSWDGDSQCTRQASAVFAKSIEPAFQIHLDNGEVFQCSGKHRVLLAADSDGLRPSGWVSIDRLIRKLDAAHWLRTESGWKASYGAGARHYDLRLQVRSYSARGRFLSQSDVPSSARCSLNADAWASIFEYNRAYRQFGHPSIQDAMDRAEVLCDTSLARAASRIVLPKFGKCAASARSQIESSLERSAWAAASLQQVRLCAAVSNVLLAFDSPILLGGNRIVAVISLGLQPIVDFEVPTTHNYMAAGVVHHNSGKTIAGAYEMTCHLTGKYPRWWRGKRFEDTIDAWCAGDTARTVRDILQKELLGPPGDMAAEGTGMIPGDLILGTSVKHGLSDCVEAVRVKHVSGAASILHFKSFDQGRQAFQGTSQHVIWADEECAPELWTEMLLRTMTVSGIVYLTATPLLGLTDLMLAFLPEMRPTAE